MAACTYSIGVRMYAKRDTITDEQTSLMYYEATVEACQTFHYHAVKISILFFYTFIDSNFAY